MKYKHDNSLVVAHYYTTPDIQKMADVVGDSLDLALVIAQEKPKRVVHASVRFMAETAKMLSPNTEVILPDWGSTCSLVEQTKIDELRAWRNKHPDHVHAMYINSSAEMKTLADIIVTSRNAVDIVQTINKAGRDVMFSPDLNMGAYINHAFGFNMPVYSSVCEVHDRFDHNRLDLEWRTWTDGPKYLIAHPEAPLMVLNQADHIASTHGMLKWIREFPHSVGTIFVATEEGLLYNMREERPELDIRQAPTHTGCQCNQCPYMKLNTQRKVLDAINGVGTKIDYLTPEMIERAKLPVERMIEFNDTEEVNWL